MSLSLGRALRGLGLLSGLAACSILLAACTTTAAPTPLATIAVPTPAMVATATMQVLPTPTSDPNETRIPAPNPDKLPTPVAILYQFHDWGTDFRGQHPEWGPVGSVQLVTWEQVNPAPGQYDWSALERGLDKERGLTVELESGEVISKPVALEVPSHLSSRDGWAATFYDATPGWVYDRIETEGGGPRPVVNGRKVGYAISGCGDQPAVLPMYDNPTWQRAYWDMVRALGKRYESDRRVTAVFIATGLDGETQPLKENRCGLDKLAEAQLPPLVYPFQQFVLDTMRVYREAFPTKPIFISNCPGGASVRTESAQLAASLKPPVGLKNAGLWVDVQNHQGLGKAVGSWDPIATYSETLPIWLESAYGFGSPELYYWMWYAGLHYHPQAIDVHPAVLEKSDPAWLSFAQRHLGVTRLTTPDVWTVMRDSEFAPITWGDSGADGHSGKVGDWTFWMSRMEQLAGNKTVHMVREDLPETARPEIYSRHARRTDQASGNTMMSFNIDDRVWFAGETSPAVAYEAVLTFLNHGDDTLSLEYVNRGGELVQQTIRKGATLGPADHWVEHVWRLPDAVFANGLPGGADLRINCNGDGDEIIHRLLVRGIRR